MHPRPAREPKGPAIAASPSASSPTSIAVVMAGIGMFAAGDAHGQQRHGIGRDAFGELGEACELSRRPLRTRIVTQSSLAAATAERTADGWAAIDEDSGDVLLLGEAIELSYRIPGAWSGGGETPVIVPGSELALIDVGDRELTPVRGGEPYAVSGEPSHAVSDGRGRVVYVASGSIFALDLESREATRLLTPGDFGMTVDEAKGLPPEGRLRLGDDGVIYVAWRAQSTIWRVQEGAAPTLLVERCVPERLSRTHLDAPRVDFSHLGFPDSLKVSVSTINDFVVLKSGEILVLGELSVGDAAHRSIELYRADGTLEHAWELAVPMAIGRFDPSDPRRILLWRRWTAGEADRRLVLIELNGEGYPG